jgi:hypothetical protein
MVTYLHRLRKSVTVNTRCLFLDQFDAHDAPAVHQTANSVSIELLLIPRGGTGRSRPRDRRPFGALKAKGWAKCSQQHMNHPGMICTRDHQIRCSLIGILTTPTRMRIRLLIIRIRAELGSQRKR